MFSHRMISRGLFGLMNLQKCYSADKIATNLMPVFNRAVKLDSLRYISDHSDDSIFNVETEEEFDEKVTNAERPVLVDFYADWCGPCKVLGPILEAKVTNRDGKVSLAKIDVDFAESLPERFNIRAVPTVLAIKNGEIVNRFEGLVDETQLEEFIDDLVERP
uniref:Thioredoxin domain-containing protein n=1 Tax=Acrobeloides nanus TaxID=290746 RepID=A0A914DTR9_9BILA